MEALLQIPKTLLMAYARRELSPQDRKKTPLVGLVEAGEETRRPQRLAGWNAGKHEKTCGVRTVLGEEVGGNPAVV